jgi:hypothetical protein
MKRAISRTRSTDSIVVTDHALALKDEELERISKSKKLVSPPFQERPTCLRLARGGAFSTGDSATSLDHANIHMSIAI